MMRKYVPTPSGVTAPNPVTTTLRIASRQIRGMHLAFQESIRCWDGSVKLLSRTATYFGKSVFRVWRPRGARVTQTAACRSVDAADRASRMGSAWAPTEDRIMTG
jgi:hypothetical protein